MMFSFFLLVSKTDKPLGDFTVQNQLVKLICWQAFSFIRFFNCFFLFSFQAEINVFQRWIPVGKSHHASLTLKRRDVVFNQSGKGMKSEIDIWLILTNHYFHAQNLSVRNEENNGLLAGGIVASALLRNILNIRIYLRKKTYRFCNLGKWKDFNKKQLTLSKMCVTSLVCGPWADLWPLNGLYCKRFTLYI